MTGICHERRAFRTFRINRIEGLTDARSGEIISEIGPWLLRRADEVQDGVAPPRIPRRRIISPVRFEEGRAVDWAFGVPEAFKPALDIQVSRHILSERAGGIAGDLRQRGFVFDYPELMADRRARRRMLSALSEGGLVVQDLRIDETGAGQQALMLYLETQGEPPAYRFSAGDIFYSPANTDRSGSPGEVRHPREIVQVMSSVDDELVIQHRRISDREQSAWVNLNIMQDELVDILRHGTSY